jgi:hypothetical protein
MMSYNVRGTDEDGQGKVAASDDVRVRCVTKTSPP